ncbi:MAG: hypothetical protein EOR99_31475 [Mesorhizobium sp.]|nr:MAG: hypothetical protein EOR81_30910 [Mesorhizobium sp.]RWN52210.1 MAG: hypothetical protein EOS00_33220 [Mesorhizobium sp.]RWN61087.1 MAG: hypothetical protein EOR99_31475 [Mesorhizobium sp.]TIO13793.1 MAG: hypothetical protein E5X86_27635 [Mesorhizobium sp.]TIR30048.1 MAG: hypothetical protein E5X35_24080 [Mesorhizobium sp.]
MTATIINGTQIAASVIDAVRSATASLERNARLQPGLAVNVVRNAPPSHAQVSSKSKTVKGCGFQSVQHTLPEATTQEELPALVAGLNADPSIHRILVQLPLPRNPACGPIVQSIRPGMDVDCLYRVRTRAAQNRTPRANEA